jgi:hypothetical protein
VFPVFSAFFLFFGLIWLAAFGGLVLGISALISVARTPTEAFGPWWDNTRQLWLIGIAVGFVIPFGMLIAGIMWFSSGRAPLRAGHGYAGRPFWAGPPKPQPTLPPPGWPGYAPPGYAQPGYLPPGHAMYPPQPPVPPAG